MKLSEFKAALAETSTLRLLRPDGVPVPAHFHITEAGLNTRQFFDCGRKFRVQMAVNLQVWVASDTHHRLSPAKLLGILGEAQPLFGQHDPEVEFEYTTDTLGRYGVAVEEQGFRLVAIQADCLAKETCAVPSEKPKIRLSDLNRCC